MSISVNTTNTYSNGFIPAGMATDGRYLYIVANQAAAGRLRIGKVDTTAMGTMVTKEDYPDTDGSSRGVCSKIIYHEGFLYTASASSPANLYKIRASDLELVGALEFPTGFNFARGLATDGENIYISCSTSPTRVVKVSLATMQVTHTWVSDSSDDSGSWLCLYYPKRHKVYIAVGTSTGVFPMVTELNAEDLSFSRRQTTHSTVPNPKPYYFNGAIHKGDSDNAMLCLGSWDSASATTNSRIVCVDLSNPTNWTMYINLGQTPPASTHFYDVVLRPPYAYFSYFSTLDGTFGASEFLLDTLFAVNRFTSVSGGSTFSSARAMVATGGNKVYLAGANSSNTVIVTIVDSHFPAKGANYFPLKPSELDGKSMREDIELSWSFKHPDPLETQSAYRVQIREKEGS